MSRRLVKAVLVCIILILSAAASFADMPIAQRLENQQSRIDRGIGSGWLPQRTADIAQNNLEWIKKEFYRLKRAGMLSPVEITWINGLIDENSGMISGQIEPRILKPAIRERIANQQRRIDDGIASGRLSRSEADIVQDNLNWIKGKFARTKADGSLSPREIDRLNHMLDRNGEMIFKEKHNEAERIY